MLEVTPVRKTADLSTSWYLPEGPDSMVELESGKKTSENEQEESRLREEQTKEPNSNSNTVREQVHRERKIDEVDCVETSWSHTVYIKRYLSKTG